MVYDLCQSVIQIFFKVTDESVEFCHQMINNINLFVLFILEQTKHYREKLKKQS